MVHGCARGQGVYCSPSISTASNYAHGTILLCLVCHANVFGNIWVAPTSQQILPCYLLSFYRTLWGGGQISDYSYSCNPQSDFKIVQFIPGDRRPNQHKKFRKLERTWLKNY